MSVARVTEITSSSKKSFQDAIEKGIARAAKTLKNVEGAWIQDRRSSSRPARLPPIAST